MALTKKGSRLITVDGIVYRWRVRGKPTYAQALCERPLTLAIEQADCTGSVLLVSMPQDHPSNWIGGPPVPVLPSTVAAVVRKALAEGWRPSQPAAAFHMATPDLSPKLRTP
ncbi:hypothetical protein [Micromonospora noduli]|uniref:hypothetical protein n=1 Tax=Micromonospora noduli TaxID=709876 RepID=UPI000DC4B7CD|nr:hypothetical protein [Micromonospora noduli]RAO11831.1 hypothetical protein LUPAC07_04724 [Micromonospora noduli]